MVAGELREARQIVEPITRRDPSNRNALMLLGKIHLDWPVIGRFKAWRLFRRAARISPGDPEPYYQQMLVGMRLEGDDGERMARDAIFRTWEIDPHYKDTWDVWGRLYQGQGHYRRATDILATHAGDPVLDLRRAKLLIRLEDFSGARSLLSGLLENGRQDAAVWALLAEASLLAGEVAVGIAYYQTAIETSATDSLGLLWEQISPIASLAEDSSHGSLAPANRPSFYRGFWERREPDLTAPGNERISEHFTRLRVARRAYHLRHPMSMFHRSETWRALQSWDNQLVAEIAAQLDPSPRGLVDDTETFPDTLSLPLFDARDVPETRGETRYRRFGFDGRGLLYLRFGEPSRLFTTFGTGESWVDRWFYRIGGQQVSITLAHHSGDLLLNPISRQEFENTKTLLENDDTSIDATIPMKIWVATFRSHLVGGTEVYIRTSPEGSTVALWDEDWNRLLTHEGFDLHILTATGGVRHVGVDHRSNEEMGRIRGTTRIPSFGPGRLSVSSILIGLAADSAEGRKASAKSMPVDLRFPTDSAVKLYSEIYELQADGRAAEYYVEYTFQKTDDDTYISFAFTRRTPWQETVVENMIIEPGRIPEGNYNIVLRIRDQIGNQETAISRVNVRFD